MLNIFFKQKVFINEQIGFMKKNLLFWVLVLMLSVNQVLAQGRTLSGTVTDADDGEPLIGVSVLVKGTTQGAVTDIDGNYTISNVAENASVLVFSYVGYPSREVEIGQSSTVNVKLQSGIELDETVVTAFGVSKEKKTLGYSVTEVKGEDLIKGAERSAINALQGRVAGLDVMSSSSGPGSSTRFLIRGASTLRGDNEPLIVVDGVPFSNNARFGGGLNGTVDNGNMINAINPDDIENMSVLKGAAATSLYGTAGANGVILITTKRGKDTDGLKNMGITYTHNTTFSTLLKTPNYQDTWGQGWSGLHYLDEQGSWGPKFDGIDRVFGNVVDNSQMLKKYSPLKNRLQDFYDTGVEFQNAISFVGGTKDYDFYASYSNNYTNGVLPGKFDTYNRNTLALRASKNTGIVKLGVSLNYAKTNQNGVPGGQSSVNGSSTVFNDLIQAPVDISFVDMKDYTNKFFNLDNFYTPYGVTNPYLTMNNVRNTYNSDKLYGSGTLGIDITKWLTAQYRFGFDIYSDNLKNWEAIQHVSDDSPLAGIFSSDNDGYISEARAKSQQFNHDFFLNFNQNFAEKISLDGFLGFNINERSVDNFSASVKGLTIPDFYNISNSASTPVVNQSITKRRRLGAFGQASVGYDGYVYLTYSARNDWSSTLPKGNNSFFYNSLSASYIISNHFKNNRWFNFGKLRVSYGTAGNDAPAYVIDPVFVQGAINYGFGDLDFPLGGLNAFEVANRIGNLNLKPEFTKEFEVGGEFVFFDSRLRADISYYNKITKDQIIALSLPSESGYTSMISNVGDIRNKGIELSFSADVLKFKDFTWSVYGNYSKNKNIVESLPEEIDKYDLGGLNTIKLYAVQGQPLGVFEAEVAKTVLIDGVEHIVVDAAGIPVAASEKEFVGNMQNKFTMGVGSGISYKGLSVNVLFDIRKGGLMYSRTKGLIDWTGGSVVHNYNDRNPFIIQNAVREVEGANGEIQYVESTTPIAMENYYRYYGDNVMNNELIDRSFVKLRELSISYTLPVKAIAKSPFNDISFSLTGRNLFIWTPKSNQYVDPEASSFGTGIDAGYGEFSTSPSLRNFGIGVKLGF